MKRKIVFIDSEKCTGCGACADACHEGAIAMVDGKAKLIKDDYCDGLGACLPSCPADAIRIIEREAAAFDEAAVLARQQAKETPAFVCPGMQAARLKTEEPEEFSSVCPSVSRLAQWPAQIKLVAPNAPYFDNAKLLIAADCTAYAYAAFHERFMKGHITLIGCPKLDDVDYSEKLAEILALHSIQSIDVARMEVPCCGGIEYAVEAALRRCGKDIPLHVTVVSIRGEILT